MDYKLAGKLVFISGSTLGIGYAIAKQYAVLGAHVVVNGRSESSVQKAVDSLREVAKGKLYACTADISTEEGARKAIDFISVVGPLHVLVNNMGIFEPKSFADITDSEWMHFFNVNVLSTIRLCRVFLADMLKRNEGNIVFIASELGVSPKPFMVHYSITKTAQLGLSRALAELTVGTRVRVNAILPGPTWTEGVATFIEQLAQTNRLSLEEQKVGYFKTLEPTSLIQRFIQPEEIANTVVYISSDLASATNGAAIKVEGGIVRHIL